MIMDNHSINYTARTDHNAEEYIRCALIMMLAGDDPTVVTSYRIEKMVGEGMAFDRTLLDTLVLYTGEPDDKSVPLAYPHNLDQLTSFVAGWVRNVRLGPKPDIDGSCEPGYRMFTDEYGDVSGRSSALIGVQPMWAIIHV